MKQFVVFLILLVVFSVGCQELEMKEGMGIETMSADEAANKGDDEKVVVDSCTPRWDCIDDVQKAYLLENCTWANQKTCPLGCSEGECNVGEVCESGFKCADATTRGYQLASCKWTQTTKCEWGCANATCNAKPLEEEIESIEEDVLEEILHLEFGESIILERSDSEYTLEIYDIIAGEVQLSINGDETDWLSEWANISYGGSDLIRVEEILFQKFGTKSIGYVKIE